METPPKEVIITLFAFAGGVARELQNYLEHKEVSWASIGARAFVAMFSGYMFAQTIAMYNPDLALIGSGLGGWMGPGAMQFIAYIFNKKFGYEKK